MSDEDNGLLRVSPISELFRADRVALWATTYNLDLDLFNGYLLGRLGDPPLNVVVLADRDRLDATLGSLPPERLPNLHPVNRRWLLRGARLGSGRFHPKSYLAVTARSALLLIGSGNLSTNGLDAGREVFTSFAAGTPSGDAAIRTWMSWMRSIVSELGDTLLAGRFTDLEARLPRPDSLSAVVDSPLWHNLDRPLAEQFCERVLDRAEQVDELIVTAPYYDETGDALGRILERLQPGRVTLYTTSTTKVDGSKLLDRLASTDAEVSTFAYLPEAFTHAKLIGAVSGDRGWLLSGSANLSNAALTFSAGAAGTGNVELAVIASLSEAELRQAFLPPDTRVETRALASLTTLTFDSNPETLPAFPVRITRATALASGRVEVTTDPPPHNTLRLADHRDIQPLVIDAGHATTVGPMAGPLVHLVDESNMIVSNHVVLDDPEALRRALQTGDKSNASTRPPELAASDLDTPLGQALLFLQRTVVMDVSETAGKGVGSDATRAEVGGDDHDDLWDRLEREKLGRDPRAGAYGRLFGSGSTADSGEPIVELLDAMRERVPGEPTRQTLLMLISSPIAPGNPGTGSPWSRSARVRVRARNVLRRWASVQTDPRLTWVDPLAPLGNLQLIAATFAQLWRYSAEPDFDAGLTDEDLDDLWMAWLRPFVGTGVGDGWLNHSNFPEHELRTRLRGDFGRNVTALCWLAIRPGPNLRQRLVEWQPVLKAVLDWGLFEVGEDTVEYLAATGHRVSKDRVETGLLEALEFIDDELWCAQKAAELDLTNLDLKAVRLGPHTSIRLLVGGVQDPLNDHRIPSLVASIGQYRRTDTVTVFGTDIDWRLAISPGTPIYFLASLNESAVESAPIDSGAIEGLAAANGVLAGLFPAAARSA